jgi:hypothetical protein
MVQPTRPVTQAYIKPADLAGPHGTHSEAADHVNVLPESSLLRDRRAGNRERVKGGPSQRDGQAGKTAEERVTARKGPRDDERGGGNSSGDETGQSRGPGEEYELDLLPFAAVAGDSETLAYTKTLPVPARYYRGAGVPAPYLGSGWEEPNPFLGSEDGVKFGWEDPLRPGVRLPLRFRWVSPLSVENI